MKVPLEWLKDYVPIRPSVEALANLLTMAGIEVTAIERVEGDQVLDLEITPNRSDCLSIIGVAREVAAMTGQPLKLPSTKAAKLQARGKSRQPTIQSGPPKLKLTIHIEDRQGCERYIGRLIDDVRVAPAPAWMQRRLIACGVRPINNVVDATNYVLLEYGQPLHAFDFDRLAQGTILVRRAQTNETMTTLDGMSRRLASDTLVIADTKQAIAVAGVMGGTGSEITPQTRTLLLESALFDPLTIRRTARKLGLASESSYRFERGVDPMGVEAASERASALIQELTGGEEVAVSDVGAKPLKRTGIIVDAGRASQWLGMPLSPTGIRTSLARLSCQVASSDTGTTLHVSVPSFRRDLTQDVDLYEELARMGGYEKIPTAIPNRPILSPRGDEATAYERAQSLRCLCASLGLTEVITWSLVSEAQLVRCGYAATQAAHLANPLSQDHAYVRPSLLIGLLPVVRHNLAQGAAGVRAFELGRVVVDGNEQSRLGMVLAGLWLRDWQAAVPCDFFRLKGLVQALMDRLCGGTLQVIPTQQGWTQPGQGAELRLKGRLFGVIGHVCPAMTKALDIEQPVWFAELFVEELLASRRSITSVVGPTTFPPVKRDLSLVVNQQTASETINRAIYEVAGTLATRVELIDRYTGPQVPAGQYSLTFAIEYREPTRTLTAAEVDAVHGRIGRTLIERFGVTLR